LKVSTAWRVDQRPLTQIRTLQHRFYSYDIRVGEDYSRITSIGNIPPSISITDFSKMNLYTSVNPQYRVVLLP